MVSRHLSTLRITGEHVLLRWWTSRDEQIQRTWPRYTDPFSQLWNIPRPLSGSDGLFNFYTSSTPRRAWAIEDGDGTLIGRISLRDIEQRQGQARLGISLGAPYVSKRLGTEALRLFIDYYFDEIGFRIMVLDVAAFNRRAVRCYERLGFLEISNEWRRTGGGQALTDLKDPANEYLQPYFKQERYSLWVQFLEMELRRTQWYEMKLRS
ncbi:MAG: GNAT family N-acetyltransferase [Chloroflexaceae bacterium]|nr:GNAT family N-acetyltransferase [Chloroflexaceae bacterium]NJL33959.1 GNAT family N-acetyltransferase [Chloroflexaceae bacterium]NJO07486.1 GNAT family N-acetyltransferase [Chloroflexaceae bacterium]